MVAEDFKNLYISNSHRILFVALVFVLFILFGNISVFGQDEIENLPPVANPSLDISKHEDPNTVKVKQAVYFQGKESYDPNAGDILIYSWDFDDGTTSDEISPVHVYHQTGEYNVKLTVNDSRLADTSVINLFVMSEGNHDPVAKIKLNAKKDKNGNNYANVSEPIIFDASSSYDPERFPLNYEWDFGDGDRSSKMIVTHKFNKDDVYTVKLTVTDSESKISRDFIQIKIGMGATGSVGNKEEPADESTNLGYIILGVVLVIIILLIIFWLFLGRLRKRAEERAETITTIREEPAMSRPTPTTPTFSKPNVQEKESVKRRARMERLKGSEAKMKKTLMREKLKLERKKVDDDMKKELEDMGIEI